MEGIRRVAIYVRVSTIDQSNDLQLQELKKYANARNWKITGIYEDKATGTNSNRPQLKTLLHDSKEDKFDLILCWKLDRLFRSLKDLLSTIQFFSDNKIEFISLKDQIDLSTNSGRLMMQIIGAFAEFEASLIRTRVKSGLEAARNRGVKLGRKKDRPSELIWSLYQSGHSYRKIAHLAKVSIGTVHNEIKSRPVQHI